MHNHYSRPAVRGMMYAATLQTNRYCVLRSELCPPISLVRAMLGDFFQLPDSSRVPVDIMLARLKMRVCPSLAAATTAERACTGLGAHESALCACRPGPRHLW